jgi:hypothetical protein
MCFISTTACGYRSSGEGLGLRVSAVTAHPAGFHPTLTWRDARIVRTPPASLATVRAARASQMGSAVGGRCRRRICPNWQFRLLIRAERSTGEWGQPSPAGPCVGRRMVATWPLLAVPSLADFRSRRTGLDPHECRCPGFRVPPSRDYFESLRYRLHECGRTSTQSHYAAAVHCVTSRAPPATWSYRAQSFPVIPGRAVRDSLYRRSRRLPRGRTEIYTDRQKYVNTGPDT